PYEHGMAETGTAVMVGNQTVPGWSHGPASLSSVVHRYLRDKLGFHNNLVVTDALNAVAIENVTSNETQAVVRAIKAGNDMALFIESSGYAGADALPFGDIKKGLKQAVREGEIPKRQIAMSVARKLAAQHISACSLIKPSGKKH
ncbi:MAG: glycoside hydrolase family 3 N-terminal domain-containing protein, partial [Candidatus Saccharimonadales bacterium]